MRQAWGPGICGGQWTWGSRLPALKRQDLQLLRLLLRFAEHLSMSSISDGRSGEHPEGMGQVSIMLSQVGRGRGHWLF